ncbi:hypothetical protein [Aneurinibacillus tyrosinisolvens]|uniref:hypothetical protein n=1 Tax=Aneurinibacillus tyrosinisolvens TaxID=1443435 RepID=UPI00063F2CE9|nr:hypothetical protein [Aneurinibacillus tyrosinisolvens]
MTAPAGVILTNKQDIIKEREGQRLARYLRILFGFRKLDFNWTNNETSYIDKNGTIHIIYNVQTPQHRPFSVAEHRIIRKGHAIHECGHKEYDIIEDFFNWIKENQSSQKQDWMDNKKYPQAWTHFFGNVMLDGRMENFVVIDRPTTKEYIDFVNYEWTFGNRGEHAGENNIADFRSAFMHRALGMTDIPDWDKEAVELVDSIQPLIDDARIAASTQECLNLTLTMMRTVWPQLLEWMDLNNESPSDFKGEDNRHEGTDQWGDREEVEQNTKRILVRIAASKEEKPTPQPEEKGAENQSDSNEETEESDNEPTNSYASILNQEQKAQDNDEEEADRQLAPYKEEKIEVEVPNALKPHQEVIVRPFEQHDRANYEKAFAQVKQYIPATSKALQQLLESINDEELRNQRQGRIKASRAWRVDTLGQMNVFERTKKGTPGKNARMQILNDISGSTGGEFANTKERIIDEMRRAQVLLIESAEEANVPCASYAFTDSYRGGDIIYPIKPYGLLGEREKAQIGGLSPQDANRDTVCLQWAVDNLATHSEDVKLLVMLSDGLPCFEEGESFDTVRQIVLNAEKRGVEVLCLFVGPQREDVKEAVRQMYPGRAIMVDHNLPRALSQQVKRIIKKYK